jgi:hypothetical protein
MSMVGRSARARDCGRCCSNNPSNFLALSLRELLSYALRGRLEYYDRSAVREIVRGAAEREYRWSAIILGIVESPTFLIQAAGMPPR